MLLKCDSGWGTRLTVPREEPRQQTFWRRQLRGGELVNSGKNTHNPPYPAIDIPRSCEYTARLSSRVLGQAYDSIGSEIILHANSTHRCCNAFPTESCIGSKILTWRWLFILPWLKVFVTQKDDRKKTLTRNISMAICFPLSWKLLMYALDTLFVASDKTPSKYIRNVTIFWCHVSDLPTFSSQSEWRSCSERQYQHRYERERLRFLPITRDGASRAHQPVTIRDARDWGIVPRLYERRYLAQSLFGPNYASFNTKTLIWGARLTNQGSLSWIRLFVLWSDYRCWHHTWWTRNVPCCY